MASPRARRVDVPETLLNSREFKDAHYMSAYELPARDARSVPPEEWGRATFEGAPAPLRGFLVLGWTQVLRLRLGPRSSGDHILGWHLSGPVSTQDESFDSLVLEGHSGSVATYNAVLAGGDSVVWATAVHFLRPAGNLLWRTAQPVHQLVVPALLKRAGRSLAPG
ncbi:DUF2867 domain-containing protein [Streptomyces armeniacus]|uniref:DUF2867 domain-containing protein n=1 Tax=Streptomyces armeniacus TaxID=83291 RepID=A0A345XT85_9ACTN|nr:DUF2867 domain-containing protein [Streptomyces armeniacus]AXK34851.1 DUF2867 domain-containing protein [Streptomyces armeniacus]